MDAEEEALLLGSAGAYSVEGATQRRALYQLVARQLADDGFEDAARAVLETTGVPAVPTLERDHLLRLFCAYNDHCAALAAAAAAPEQQATLPPMTARYVATHKKTVTCAAVNASGRLAATGSEDGTVKVIDLNRVNMGTHLKASTLSDQDASKPVLRTYNDHSKSITDVAFHPWRPFMLSASLDCSVRLYDVGRANTKRAFRQIAERDPVHSVHVHPGGDFALVGLEHPQIRLYDLGTLQPFSARDEDQHHLGPVCQTRFSPSGSMFVSCSEDGSVKLWDATNFQCVRTLLHAHSGSAVNSACFSRDGSRVLTHGRDGTTAVWDTATGRRELELALEPSEAPSASTAAFSHDDSLILGSIDALVVAWDARTGAEVGRFEGHTKPVHAVAPSPVDPSFISCGADARARCWALE